MVSRIFLSFSVAFASTEIEPYNRGEATVPAVYVRPCKLFDDRRAVSAKLEAVAAKDTL